MGKKLRYALRKQDKIKASLGANYLEKHILDSLDLFFSFVEDGSIYDNIELDGYVTEFGNSYSLLRINDIANENAMLEFAVIGRMHDVFHLSYIGRMKG